MSRRDEVHDNPQSEDEVERRNCRNDSEEYAHAHPFHTEGVCLTFDTDTELKHRLKKDPSADIDALRATVPTRVTSVADKALFGSKFYTVMQHAYLKSSDLDATEVPLLFNMDFRHLMFGVLLHEETYDVWAPGTSSSDFDKADFDPVRLGMLYMVLRLFSKFLYIEAVQYDPDRSPYEGKLLDITRRFWRILWKKRVQFFHARLMNTYVQMPRDTDPMYLSCALADCVGTIEGMWDKFGRSHEGDMHALHALLFTWVYIADAHCRREPLFNRFALLLHKLDADAVQAFQNDCLATATPHQTLCFTRALRRNILSNNNTNLTCFSLLDSCAILAHDPHMAEGMEVWGKGRDHPVSWIMKAIQRQLCMRAGSELEYKIVTTAFECIACWSHFMRRALIEIVHADIGVPFLPYLGRLAVLTMEERPDQDRAYQVLERLVMTTARWLGSLDHPADRDALVKCAASRRAWITTLTDLRELQPGRRGEEILNLWVNLGNAHGFRVDKEYAWLEAGNAKPSSRNAPPTEVCGWSGCFCHEQKPLYALHACRCGKVYYCGKECQKRAWKEGHRMICSRKRRDKNCGKDQSSR